MPDNQYHLNLIHDSATDGTTDNAYDCYPSFIGVVSERLDPPTLMECIEDGMSVVSGFVILLAVAFGNSKTRCVLADQKGTHNV